MDVGKAEADLRQVRSQIQRLEGQLAEARDRELKIRHFLEMASLYSGGGQQQPSEPSANRRGGASGEAVRSVIAALREAGRPMTTKELLRHLDEAGLSLRSAPGREVVNLSAYLSRAPELKNDRVLGWSLAEWKTKAPVPSTPASRAEPDDGPSTVPGNDERWLGERPVRHRSPQQLGNLDDEIPF
ncbi:MAG TPA: hypothetical protein VD970_12890 [Acetobacteraceae bacterium]|nr:hypothetical protein [Acetobacteraceae bacterium]